MKPKYELGQEVTVEFIGKITEIKLNKFYNAKTNKTDFKLVYNVDGTPAENLGVNIEESYIYPLPQDKTQMKEEK